MSDEGYVAATGVREIRTTGTFPLFNVTVITFRTANYPRIFADETDYTLKIAQSAAVFLTSVGCTAALVLSTSTSANAASTALMVNGIGLGGLPDIVMSNVLGGMFSGTAYQRQNVVWPEQARPVTGPNSLTLGQSVDVGADNLDAAIKAAVAQLGPGETVTVVGLSAGALVLDAEMRRLAADPNAPDKSKLTFIVVADSSRIPFNANRHEPILGYTFTVPANTRYNTIAVAAEYDGFADFPDRAWNVVAVANAFAGAIFEHVNSVGTDLSTVPAENITVTTNSLSGVTKSYLIPAAELPLVKLLPYLKSAEPVLKQVVDSAYARNDNTGPAATSATTATSAAVATATSVAAAEIADTQQALETPVVDNPVVENPAPRMQTRPGAAPADTDSSSTDSSSEPAARTVRTPRSAAATRGNRPAA